MVILGLLGGLVLIVVAAIVLVATIAPKPFAEQYVTKALGRRLAIGTLQIGWGDPLSVQITDLRLANAPWGSAPEMVRIESLSALIDLRSLFSTHLRFDKLDIVNPQIILERDASGTGNWRFSGVPSASPEASPLVPSTRPRSPRFPTLIDAQLHRGNLTLRTSSGAILKIDMHELGVRSTGEDDPVSLTLDGAYNGTPVRLNGETQSYTVLRNPSVPFGVEFVASTPASNIKFKGTMMAPLDFDGVQGPMQIDATPLGDFLKIFGVDVSADYPLLLAGQFTRTGDHWELSDISGKVASSAFGGALKFTEGNLGKPDDASIAANFMRLDLNPILAGKTEQKPVKGRAPVNNDFGALPLQMDAKRDPTLDAQIKAKELVYRTMRFVDFGLHGRLASGEVAVSQLTFALAGDTLAASGSAHNANSGSRVIANATVAGADASQLGKLLGAESSQIAGKIDGRVTLEMTGKTVRDALKSSRGHAVLSMANGRIARSMLEKISTDLRSLFRKNADSAQISCLLGVMDLQDGRGTISPFRLKTPEANVIGGGEVDFPGERLDITIKSVSASTGIFALDIPVHISGSFAHPKIVPAIGSSAKWLDAPARNNPAHALPPPLQQLADRNPCSN